MDDTTLRLIVVDDHDLFRTGLATLLGAEPGIEVIAQASGGAMAIRLAAELRPDAILMDVRMPDVSGPKATRQIVANDPSVRVLALTVASEDRDIAEVLEAGAVGFLAKDTPVESLVVAIRAAVKGGAWLSPRAADVVLGRLRDAPPAHEQDSPELARLSARELDVLRLIASGMENAEIARELSISPRTAKNHVSNILTKLELPSRVQAAVYAVRQGVT